MKNVFVLLSLIFFGAMSLHASPVEGRFTTATKQVVIKIKDHRQGIRVKGLFNNRYVTFRAITFDTYTDQVGNVIRVVNPNHLIYTSRRIGDRISFFRNGIVPVEVYTNRSRNLDNRYDRNPAGRSYGPGPSDRSYGSNSGERSSRNNLSLKELEGTWKSDRPDRELVILQTRDGFKVKFSGERDWVDFAQQSQDQSIFRDKKGNEYRYLNNGDLEWRSYKGDGGVIIRKISSTLKF